MAITVLQRVLNSGGGTQTTVTLGNTTSGSTLVVIADIGVGTANVTGITISTGSATFTSAIIRQAGGAYQELEAWVAPNITGGTTPIVTVTFSASSGFQSAMVYELAGMSATTIPDGTPAGVAGPSASTMSSPAITTANAGSIIFAAFAAAGSSPSAGEAGWTSNTDANSWVLFQYQIQTATQSGLISTATQPTAGTYGSIIFALQPAGGSSAQVFVNISGTWTPVANLETNVAGTWTPVASVWQNQSGTWVQIH